MQQSLRRLAQLDTVMKYLAYKHFDWILIPDFSKRA